MSKSFFSCLLVLLSMIFSLGACGINDISSQPRETLVSKEDTDPSPEDQPPIPVARWFSYFVDPTTQQQIQFSSVRLSPQTKGITVGTNGFLMRRDNAVPDPELVVNVLLTGSNQCPIFLRNATFNIEDRRRGFFYLYFFSNEKQSWVPLSGNDEMGFDPEGSGVKFEACGRELVYIFKQLE